MPETEPTPEVLNRAASVQKKIDAADVDAATLQEVFGEMAKAERKSGPRRTALGVLDRKIRDLQDSIESQINEVMRNSFYRKLESTWRGLDRLVNNTEHSNELQVEVMDATEESVRQDLGSFGDGFKPLDKTKLHYYIYRRGLGVRGGHPYGAIVADFEIGPDEESVSVIWQMSKLAEKAHAPFIAAASPSMIRLKKFSALNLVTADLRQAQFNDDRFNFNRWNDFRKESFSCYAGLLAPKVLMRSPKSFEKITEADELCWGSPVYIYAEILNRAFAENGWCNAIRGPNATVGDMPVHQLAGGDPATQVGPTDIVFDDSVEYQFDQLGFIAFCKELNSTRAVFPGGHSCNDPGTYSRAGAQASAELSARLPNVFARSRFAHAIKAMCRDKVGDFMSAGDLEKYLKEWLHQYKLGSPEAATPEQKARRPLADYEVTVKEVDGYPGVFEADIQLRLHSVVEEVGVTMSLVAEITQPGAADD